MLDWQLDVLPVIRATYALMEERGVDCLEDLDSDELGPRLTREYSEDELYGIFQLINRADYAEVQFNFSPTIALVRPTEKGLQITYGWPIQGQGEVDALLCLLDARIASPETSEEERTRLQRLRDAAGEVSQSVLSGLLGAWLSQFAGLGGR